MKTTVLIVLLVRLSDTDAIISKCIRKGEDRVTFNCPEGHVIYQPIIFVGESTSNSCTYQEGDCTGLTYDLLTQKNKCYWQNRCSLRWRDQLPIVSSNETNCKGRLPNYVNMENSLCVPKDAVIDICDTDVDLSNINHGVIRSHSNYPWTYVSANKRCRMTLPAKQGLSLVVTVDAVDLADGDVLFIRKLPEETDVDLINGGSVKKVTHMFSDLEELQLTFKMSEVDTVGSGFIIRFEYKSTVAVQAAHSGTHAVGKHDLFRESLFNAFAAIEECITPKREQINITCPSGHVIYKPEVKVGVSTDGRCSYRLGDCLGMTHTFLTQKNVCYWKESCEFTWRTGIPITMSQSLRCLSLPPKYISISRYSCIDEDKVVELCDKGSLIINKTEGVIKSHSQYPWHYKAMKHTCRKRIRVQKGGILRMRTKDIDLDPDTKGDNIKINHIKNGRSVRRQKIRGNDPVDESFSGGCVDVTFRVSPKSKAGRGFVIQFETNSVGRLSETELDDCKKTSKKSRSKKGKKRRKKHKNRKTKSRGSHKKRNKKKTNKKKTNRSRKSRKQRNQ